MTEPPDLPAFTPVPCRARHDGWTPERQTRFIAALAAMGTVAGAARAVGKSATAAYLLRDRPGAGSFAAAWDIVRSLAQHRIFAEAIDRATNGVAVPRFYRGRQVATVRRPDYRSMEAVLRTIPLAPASAEPLHVLLDRLVAIPESDG